MSETTMTIWKPVTREQRQAIGQLLDDVERLGAEKAALLEALEAIAKHEHQQYSDAANGADYATGVADGHRCAGDRARAAIAQAKGQPHD